jgi:hypothetical protein
MTERRQTVADSRVAQGLPPQVEDPATLRRLAALLVGRAELAADRVRSVRNGRDRVRPRPAPDEVVSTARSDVPGG